MQDNIRHKNSYKEHQKAFEPTCAVLVVWEVESVLINTVVAELLTVADLSWWNALTEAIDFANEGFALNWRGLGWSGCLGWKESMFAERSRTNNLREISVARGTHSCTLDRFRPRRSCSLWFRRKAFRVADSGHLDKCTHQSRSRTWLRLNRQHNR